MAGALTWGHGLNYTRALSEAGGVGGVGMPAAIGLAAFNGWPLGGDAGKIGLVQGGDAAANCGTKKKGGFCPCICPCAPAGPAPPAAAPDTHAGIAIFCMPLGPQPIQGGRKGACRVCGRGAVVAMGGGGGGEGLLAGSGGCVPVAGREARGRGGGRARGCAF